MNRWWGNDKVSAEQASARSQRAARRTIKSLNIPVLSESDDEYAECNTSIQQVDGADDDAMADAAARAAAELARQKALPFEESDYENHEEAWKKELKLKFDPQDVKYWFNSVEADMKKYGINRQWDKKNAIKPMLPDNVIDELKPILRLTETEAGPHIYKDIKKEIFELYGPRDEDVFKKAIALRLTGKPSALGKQLIHLLCPGAQPMDGCHCDKIIYGFWEAQLTPQIRSRLAGMKFKQERNLQGDFQVGSVQYSGDVASYKPLLATIQDSTGIHGSDTQFSCKH